MTDREVAEALKQVQRETWKQAIAICQAHHAKDHWYLTGLIKQFTERLEKV